MIYAMSKPLLFLICEDAARGFFTMNITLENMLLAILCILFLLILCLMMIAAFAILDDERRHGMQPTLQKEKYREP